MNILMIRGIVRVQELTMQQWVDFLFIFMADAVGLNAVWNIKPLQMIC